jgi:hypothetical protein
MRTTGLGMNAVVPENGAPSCIPTRPAGSHGAMAGGFRGNKLGLHEHLMERPDFMSRDGEINPESKLIHVHPPV